MTQVKEQVSDNKRIAKNTLFLYFRMILIVCIGLYTSRVVLQTLGIVDYGVFHAVGGIVAMLSFLNTSMASSSQRFITYALGEGDDDRVRNVFVTSFWVHLLVAIIVFVVAETIGLWFLYEKMVIPVERFDAAFWVYQCTIFSSLLTILRVPYNSLIIAYERMSVFAYISILEVLMNLGIVYLLTIGGFDKLILYAILLLLVRIVIYFAYKCYCNKYIPTSRLRMFFERDLLSRMVKFSLWSMNGQLALVGASQGINILLNMFFGPTMNAAHGVAHQVQTHVYAFCMNFNLATKPQITKLYANSLYSEMHKLVILSSKFSFYLMLIMSLPVIVNISPILYWWLGLVPAYSAQFVVIMLITCLVRSLSFPLISSVHATGDLKRFQLWEGSTLLMVVPVAYLLLKFFHVSPLVVMSVFMVLEILAQFFRIWIVLPMIQMPVKEYVVGVVKPVLGVSILAALLPLLSTQVDIEQNLLAVFCCVMVCVLYGIAIIFYIGCNKKERQVMASYIRGKINLGKSLHK